MIVTFVPGALLGISFYPIVTLTSCALSFFFSCDFIVTLLSCTLLVFFLFPIVTLVSRALLVFPDFPRLRQYPGTFGFPCCTIVTLVSRAHFVFLSVRFSP